MPHSQKPNPAPARVSEGQPIDGSLICFPSSFHRLPPGLELSRRWSRCVGVETLNPQARVGGNLVAIQASRISTYLHFWSIPGVLPYKMRQHWPNPCISFFSSGVNSRSARVLLMLVVPGHMVFLYSISLLQGADAPPIGVTFTLCYLAAALLQVTILLYVADLIVRVMWRRSLDPDNFSIPYLTALGDLLGTGFLALCFRCTSLVHGVGQ
ncbi:unnamed protein product [Arctogadus glacialis]